MKEFFSNSKVIVVITIVLIISGLVTVLKGCFDDYKNDRDTKNRIDSMNTFDSKQVKVYYGNMRWVIVLKSLPDRHGLINPIAELRNYIRYDSLYTDLKENNKSLRRPYLKISFKHKHWFSFNDDRVPKQKFGYVEAELINTPPIEISLNSYIRHLRFMLKDSSVNEPPIILYH